MTATGSPRSVTFVGHDASRTGAPRLLVSALRWIASNDDRTMDLVLLGGGPILGEFRSVLPTRVLGGPLLRAAGRMDAATAAMGRQLRLEPAVTRLAAGRTVGDVVVASTLVSLPVAARLAGGGRRLVCHVCELDGVAAQVLPADRRRSALLDRVDRFIATGSAVAEMLTRRWGVPDRRVTTVDPWIELDRTVGPARVTEGSSLPERPTVLSIGSLRHRKGPDRFVDLMTLLSDHPTRPVGVWLGGDPGSAVGREMHDDIRRGAGPGVVRLVGDVDDVAAVLASADVVVSTAIEEPYSVAMLEAASAGVPLAGFSSGGLDEGLAAVGQGDAVVGLDDLVGLAGVVAGLLDDPSDRRRRGQQLARWVRGSHLAEHLVPAWWEAVTG